MDVNGIPADGRELLRMSFPAGGIEGLSRNPQDGDQTVNGVHVEYDKYKRIYGFDFSIL